MPDGTYSGTRSLSQQTKCFNNLTAMAQEGPSTATISLPYPSYAYRSQNFEGGASIRLRWKLEEAEYTRTIEQVKTIDLSSNLLVGGIPDEIVRLLGLNLSRNYLTGSIPPLIGQLHVLNFLDLLRNQLSGSIPTSLSQLTHIGVLDLSYNNLSGRVPVSTQLQTFNVSVYVGNSGLCGSPVTKNCPGDEVILNPEVIGSNTEEDSLVTSGFYVSMALGFIIGFWGICGSFLIK